MISHQFLEFHFLFEHRSASFFLVCCIAHPPSATTTSAVSSIFFICIMSSPLSARYFAHNLRNIILLPFLISPFIPDMIHA